MINCTLILYLYVHTHTYVCVCGFSYPVNSQRPRHDGRHFADDIFKCIFLNENVWIPIKMSPTFVPKGPNNNIPAMVQIMAWHHPSDKPLSEPMVVSLPTHICVTRPQSVNDIWQSRQRLFVFICLCKLHNTYADNVIILRNDTTPIVVCVFCDLKTYVTGVPILPYVTSSG